MPWRTFWGYINGYSERPQVVIPAQKKICRDIKKVCNLYQKVITWIYISAFILLKGP